MFSIANNIIVSTIDK